MGARKRLPSNPVRYDRDVELILRQTYEKQQVLFLKLHAVQVEVQELRREVQAALRLVLALVHDPEMGDYASAVVRDFLREKGKRP